MTAKASRVLVVEDEALIMLATLDMLRELGHDPVPARSGEAALALLTGEDGIAAVVTDVNLPGMDGQALAQELRRRRPGMPIIFATGYRLVLQDGIEASGPTAVVSKPYLAGELAAALAKVLPRAG
jgi:CheY-like chemotaxis protein